MAKKVKKTPEEILESRVADELLGTAIPIEPHNSLPRLELATDVEVVQGFLVDLARRMESLEAKFDSLSTMIISFHSVPERNTSQGHKVSSKSS